MKRTRYATTLVAVAIGFAACGGKAEDDSACSDLTAKLRSCHLLTEGELRCNRILKNDPQCVASCIAQTDCSAIAWALCDSGAADDEVIECLTGCQDAVFECGSGETVPPSFRCNVSLDCTDGSDEQGCPPKSTFQCDSGASVGADGRCDGERDCEDGSDESGCARLLCEG